MSSAAVVNWLHFVSLIYRKQFAPTPIKSPIRCELTTFRIFDISQTVIPMQMQCKSRCELTTFRIFDISQTVRDEDKRRFDPLWIDYISYLWYIANSQSAKMDECRSVVNWLHFVSLIYRKQWKASKVRHALSCELTTFRIFDISQTVRCRIEGEDYKLWIDYISYLWYIANSANSTNVFCKLVVNWLHFVSLIYRKQSEHRYIIINTSCELTTFRIFDISQTVTAGAATTKL